MHAVIYVSLNLINAGSILRRLFFALKKTAQHNAGPSGILSKMPPVAAGDSLVAVKTG